MDSQGTQTLVLFSYNVAPSYNYLMKHKYSQSKQWKARWRLRGGKGQGSEFCTAMMNL